MRGRVGGGSEMRGYLSAALSLNALVAPKNLQKFKGPPRKRLSGFVSPRTLLFCPFFLFEFSAASNSEVLEALGW